MTDDPLARVTRAAADKRRAGVEYRAALVAAVVSLEAAGRRDAFAEVGRAAGVARQVVRSVVSRAREVPLPSAAVDELYDADGHLLPQGGPVPDEAAMRARLDAIDGRYDAVVDALAQREAPSAAFAKRDQAFRNAQAGKRRRKGLPPLRTVRAEVRWHAESVLLKFLEDNRGVPFVERVLAELDEAAGLRESLAALEEARRGF